MFRVKLKYFCVKDIRSIIKVMFAIYFLIEFRCMKCQMFEEPGPELEDINDLFSSFTKPPHASVLKKPPGVMYKNITIDLEKIDVKKYLRQLRQYTNSNKTEYPKYDPHSSNQNRNFSNMPPGVIPNMRPEFNYTGNGTGFYNNGTHILKIPSFVMNGTNATEYNMDRELFRGVPVYAYDFWRTEYNRAHAHIVRTKVVDMALQVIYMARHKIRALESMRYFNRHDTSYRIAFLYRRLRRIWKMLMDLYTTMKKRMFDTNWPFGWTNVYVILHHKAAILHTEFLYMWWVLVKLHDKYNIRHYIPNTPQPSTTTTAPPKKKGK